MGKQEAEVKYGISFDVETSGQSARRNELMAFGVVVFRLSDGAFVGELEVFINPSNGIDFAYEKRCWDEFWGKEEQKVPLAYIMNGMKHSGVSRSVAAHRLHTWANYGVAFDTKEEFEAALNGESPPKKAEWVGLSIGVSDTAGFDWHWLTDLLDEGGFNSLDMIFGKYTPTRCVNSYNLGVARKPFNAGSFGAEKALCAAFGRDHKTEEESIAQKHTHTPLSDAKHIAMWALKGQQFIQQ